MSDARQNFKQLRTLAQEATPGPWRLQDGCSWRRIGTKFGDGDVLRPTKNPHDGWPDLDGRRATMEYIAACDPQTVLTLLAELDRLNAIINSPQSGDFIRAVSTEAEHQRQRWGSLHDSGKTPADWFWLVGYLAGKALHAHAAGDSAKAEHHMITTAAACENWHRALFGGTDMRPGIDGEASLAKATEVANG